MSRRPALAVPALLGLALAACSNEPTGPGGGGGGDGTVLEIGPSAVLLTTAGATQQLTAFLVDEGGGRTPVTASWFTSHPGIATVSGGGLVTAVGPVGSTIIVAEANGRTSAPILVLVAEPVSGALLVSDDEVDGLPEAVDPTAEYAVGWLERVRLRGVTPEVGQVVLGTGGLPIAGRVTAVSDAGSGITEITYELVPLAELFAALEVDETIPLANAPLLEGTPPPPSLAVGRPEARFSLGSFECAAAFEGTLAPVELDLASFQVTTDLSLDLVVKGPAVQRLVVHGTISPRLSVNPVMKGGIKGSFVCKVARKPIILPITGALSRFVGGQVPNGVGFAMEGVTTVGDFGYDAFLEGSASIAMGFDCSAGCTPVLDGGTTMGGFFKPVLPPALDQARAELTGSFFGWAELSLGSPLLRELQFSFVEAKAGLAQKGELATERVQALDPGYASRFQLAPAFEAGTTANVNALAGLLNVQLGSLKFEPSLPPIARSPAGTLTIEPSEVEPGDDQELGETATFTVTLDPVTYLGIGSVEAVEIRWLRPDGNGGFTLEPGRPGCTTIPASSSSQKVFTCTADFLEEHRGVQTFFAFVKPKLFGLTLPFNLEIDSAQVTVGSTSFTTSEYWDYDADAAGEERDTCSDEFSMPEPVPAPGNAVSSASCTATATQDGVTFTAQTAMNATLTITEVENVRTVKLAGGSTGSVSAPPDPEEGSAPGGFSEGGSGRAVFFTVPEGTTLDYAVTGSVAVTASGCLTCVSAIARVLLSGSGVGVVFDFEADEGGQASIPINQSGTLSPGNYVFSATQFNANFDDEPGSHVTSTSYDVTLTLTRP